MGPRLCHARVGGGPQACEALHGGFAQARGLAEAAVDVGDLGRHARGEVGHHERGHVAHVFDGHITTDGGGLGHHTQNFSKAFDTIPHDKLLSMISSTTLHSNLVRWLATYLHGRQAKCSYNSSLSKSRLVHLGVPQGGVISPHLFNF